MCMCSVCRNVSMLVHKLVVGNRSFILECVRDVVTRWMLSWPAMEEINATRSESLEKPELHTTVEL